MSKATIRKFQKAVPKHWLSVEDFIRMPAYVTDKVLLCIGDPWFAAHGRLRTAVETLWLAPHMEISAIKGMILAVEV